MKILRGKKLLMPPKGSDSYSVTARLFFREHECEGGENFKWFKTTPLSRQTPTVKVVALIPRSSKLFLFSLRLLVSEST